MPYAPHVRVSLLGKFALTGGGTPYEFFSTGFSVDRLELAGAEEVDVVDAVLAFWPSNGTGIPVSAFLTSVKFSPTGADGKLTGEPHEYAVTATAGAANSNKPTFQACAVTLESSAAGLLKRKRGRMFLPNGFDAIQGRFGANTPEGIAFAVAGLLTSVNTALGQRGVCTASRTTGVNYPVDAVTCDNVPDYLSSRKAQLINARSAPTAVGDGS